MASTLVATEAWLTKHVECARKDSLDCGDKLCATVREAEILLPTPPPELDIPTTQQALTVAAKGTYALVHNFPVPELRHGEVMIRTCAVGLNPIDWKSVDYNFCMPAFPWVNGREMSGVVENVAPGITHLQAGDRVWTSTYYRDIRAGCFQEFVTVPQHTVLRIPQNFSFEQAACIGVPALTSAMTLWRWLDVPMPSRCPPANPSSPAPASEFILIWGGSSSTGQFAIQLAALAHLTVIAVCSERTSALVRALGAHHVITRDGKSHEQILGEVLDIGGDDITRGIDFVGPSTAAWGLAALSSSRECAFVPLAFMAKGQDVPPNVEVHTVEIKRFVLDEASAVYAQELNRLLDLRLLRLPELVVLKGGLHAVESGLERLKRGDMEGKKLVVTMRS